MPMQSLPILKNILKKEWRNMGLFAIGDLHLSQSVDKPMDVFGKRWENYTKRMIDNWNEKICDGDTVLIAGDVSWAMNLKELFNDFLLLDGLPGKKIMIKGNHDYWWETIGKLKKYKEENQFKTIDFLFNNSFKVDDHIICGTRGWILPIDESFNGEDEKIYKRELGRLDLSIAHAKKHNHMEDMKLMVMLHYPPYDFSGKRTEFTDKIAEAGVQKCYFGHIHGEVCGNVFQGKIDGVDYELVSADYLQFSPRPVELLG